MITFTDAQLTTIQIVAVPPTKAPLAILEGARRQSCVAVRLPTIRHCTMPRSEPVSG